MAPTLFPENFLAVDFSQTSPNWWFSCWSGYFNDNYSMTHVPPLSTGVGNNSGCYRTQEHQKIETSSLRGYTSRDYVYTRPQRNKTALWLNHKYAEGGYVKQLCLWGTLQKNETVVACWSFLIYPYLLAEGYLKIKRILSVGNAIMFLK